MTLIDSVDSIAMLDAYSGFPEHRFALVEAVPVEELPISTAGEPSETPASPGMKMPPVSDIVIPVSTTHLTKTPSPTASQQELPRSRAYSPTAYIDIVSSKSLPGDVLNERDEERLRQLRVKRNAMSGLSIILTLMSILVAFTYVSVFRPCNHTH